MKETQNGHTATLAHTHPVLARLMIMRPQQWVKNLLVFAAFLFAGPLSNPGHLINATLLFAAFCLISSAVYIVNDLVDRDTDRVHPRKKFRPIASGLVRPGSAGVVALLLFAAGLLLALNLSHSTIACVIGYVALQISYTFLLKHVVILDILAIAAGFVLRAVAGAYAIAVMISPWLFVCTIVLALFLALSKRRSELLVSDHAQSHRPVLGYYNLALLDQMIAIVTSSTLLAYVLYTFSEQTMQKFASHLMPLTIPFVLYGIFRYLYLVYGKSQGEEPEILFIKDLPLLIDIVLWGIAVSVIVSLH